VAVTTKNNRSNNFKTDNPRQTPHNSNNIPKCIKTLEQMIHDEQRITHNATPQRRNAATPQRRNAATT